MDKSSGTRTKGEKMNPWDNEEQPLSTRFLLWLETHENEFTTKDIRNILNVPAPKPGKSDNVSSYLSMLAKKCVIKALRHENNFRIYRKSTPEEMSEQTRERATESRFQGKGFKGVKVHRIDDEKNIRTRA